MSGISSRCAAAFRGFIVLVLISIAIVVFYPQHFQHDYAYSPAFQKLVWLLAIAVDFVLACALLELLQQMLRSLPRPQYYVLGVFLVALNLVVTIPVVAFSGFMLSLDWYVQIVLKSTVGAAVALLAGVASHSGARDQLIR